MTSAAIVDLAVRAIEAALVLAPDLAETITGTDRATLEERIARARGAVIDPLPVDVSTASGRAELRRIVRGES